MQNSIVEDTPPAQVRVAKETINPWNRRSLALNQGS